MSFRKDNGFSAKLYAEHKILYLKTDAITICHFDAEGIEKALTRILNEEKPLHFILDLSTVQTVDSMFIGILIHLRMQSRIQGCRMYLMGVTEGVMRTFKVLNIGSIFGVIKSVDEVING